MLKTLKAAETKEGHMGVLGCKVCGLITVGLGLGGHSQEQEGPEGEGELVHRRAGLRTFLSRLTTQIWLRWGFQGLFSGISR